MLHIEGGPVDLMNMDTGDGLAVTTVEAPLVFDPALQHTRTLEVLDQTYVTVRRVKISQGSSLEDDHVARVEVERAFASQRSQFEEYVLHLEGHFRHQMSVGSAQLVEAREEVKGLASNLRVASASLESRDRIAHELNETIRRDAEIKSRMDRVIRQLQGVVHGSKLENMALSNRVRELERTISVGTSQHRDVSTGIERLHEALLSLGDSITTNISIVNNNTKCINDALHMVHEDTSDIRRVVHEIADTHLAHPITPDDLTSQATSTTASQAYPWSDRGLEALPVFVGPYAHLQETQGETIGSKPTPALHPPSTPPPARVQPVPAPVSVPPPPTNPPPDLVPLPPSAPAASYSAPFSGSESEALGHGRSEQYAILHTMPAGGYGRVGAISDYPTFAGMVGEDLDTFFIKLKRRLELKNVDPELWGQVGVECLTGTAAVWAESHEFSKGIGEWDRLKGDLRSLSFGHGGKGS